MSSDGLLTLGVWVSGVLVGGAGLGALEGEQLVRGAAWPLGLNTDSRNSLPSVYTECPHLVSVVTLPLAGVEDEAASAGDSVGHAVNAEVELVTHLTHYYYHQM